MTFDLISGLHMQIQTWHPPLWLCTHAKYYVKSGLTNVLKNANKTKNMHLFSIRIANYNCLSNDILKNISIKHFYTTKNELFLTYKHYYKNDISGFWDSTSASKILLEQPFFLNGLFHPNCKTRDLMN